MQTKNKKCTSLNYFNWYKQTQKPHPNRKTFNHINGNLYHYAGNNPVRYIDPDGNDIYSVTFAGVGAKLIVGGSVSVGFAVDDNDNIAIIVSGNAGIGVEANVDLPIAPSFSKTSNKNIDDYPKFGPIHYDCDFSENGLSADVGVVFSGSFDIESEEWNGCSIGTIGGGVNFLSGTLYINLNKSDKYISENSKKNIIDYLNQDDCEIPEDIKIPILKSLADNEN